MTEPTKKDFQVFVLCGSDVRSGFVKDIAKDVPLSGNNDFWRLIPEDMFWARCHLSPSYFRQGFRIDFSRCSVILNLISDPDQNPKTLRVAERLTTNYRDRLINDPRHVTKTSRDNMARTLKGIAGLHIPRVLRLHNPTLQRLRKRMSAKDFRFPAIVRRTGTQTGGIVGLFQRPEDMSDLFGTLTEEYYFTEFVDCRWSDGLYRKMRLFRIGEETILRHMLISDDWNIHGRARRGIMKDRQDLRDQEREFFEGGAEPAMTLARDIMEEIGQRTKLDYFGMDCGPTEDGQFVLFEANATMNITPQSNNTDYTYARGGLVQGKNALPDLLRQRGKPPKKPKT